MIDDIPYIHIQLYIAKCEPYKLSICILPKTYILKNKMKRICSLIDRMPWTFHCKEIGIDVLHRVNE